ncbi:MAG: AAA family ATPase [Kofleriaceae bacterium]
MNDSAAHQVVEQLRATQARLRDANVAHTAPPRDGDDNALLVAASDVEPMVTPISWLCDRLALSATEQQILWTLIAHELCPSSRHWLRELNTEQVADPTLDAIRRVVYGSIPDPRAWSELGAEGPLRQLGLVERSDGNDHDAPEHRHTLKVARRVLALVHGKQGLDPEVAGLARFVACDVDVDQLETSAQAFRALREAFDGTGLVIVRGAAGTGRRSLVAALAHERRVLAIDGRAIAREPDKAARQLRVIARECTLFDAIPLFQHLDALAGAGELADRLGLVESEFRGPVFATTTRPILRRWSTPPTVIELPPLTGAQRMKLWARALPEASDQDADQLATLYPLTPAMIHAAGRAAVRLAGAGEMDRTHIEGGIRAVLDDSLAGLATRVTVTQTWDDVILPNDQIIAIVELLARIRERRKVYEDWGFAQKVGRGLGVSALFSGPPGTGKTMCAGLIAQDLGTELYQVDLSKITSKWIGETEKNLAALFDAAESGHAILLFDEADSIFGKRTEVRSSNDRHANQETNYLLQRLESFAGICILTTNHESGIDEAFRRRLSIHVRFPVPEADERTRMWQALLPAAAPVAKDIPFAELGEVYAMSGGYIRNAVLRAAFLAANDDSPILHAHLVRAAQLEYEAMGKIAPRLR